MKNFRIIPILLVKGTSLVKGRQFKNHEYIGDPVNAVKIFNDKRADELIVLDIVSSQQKKTIDLRLVERVAKECFMPLTVGGGIRSVADAQDVFSAGAEKICLGTAALLNPDLITEIADKFGQQSVVVSLDYTQSIFRQHKLHYYSGKKSIKISSLVEHAKKIQALGAGELLVNSISKEGMMSGYDFELLKNIAAAVDVPVIASGGARGLNDVAYLLQHTEVHSVALGTAVVYHGKKRAVLISYPAENERLELVNNISV